MRVEIWADMVCAWAYIGKRRLEQALAVWEGEPVEVVWRPFRIDPTAPVPGSPLAGELCDPVADGAPRACAPGSPTENLSRVAELAAAEGLVPWGAAWRAGSHDAHRLVALAFQEGGSVLQDAVVEGLLKAHFIDGLDISSVDVLSRVASEAGFVRGAELLAEGAGEGLVRELVLVGKAQGIRTSPTFVVGGRAMAGAQSPETILAFLRGGLRPHRRLPEEVERFRHAESLLEQRDPLGALVLLRPLLDEHGEDRNVRMLAARAYYASAQLGRATTTLERLVAETPDDSYARYLLARTLQRRGLDKEAAPHLSLATTMTPEYTS